MNGLCVSLSELGESRVVTVNRTASEDNVRPADAATIGAQDITLNGVLSRVDSELLFQGALGAIVTAICDRCLTQVAHNMRQDVEWFFEPGVDADVPAAQELDLSDDDDDIDGTPVRFFSGDTLDLGPAAWEELVFLLPSKQLCREDCKGLCPVCGQNLNEGECNCAKNEMTGHPGLADLKKLYPDLPDTEED